MVKRKLDTAQILSCLQALADQSWLKRSERRWWPRFVFHYTDVRNAAKILQEGCLHCRNYLEEAHQPTVDSGSPRVLAGTATSAKHYVRLYFRPKTPTQYHIEGIRTIDQITPLHAHCPVPVFFLFDSNAILTRADCQFSDGNLASPRAQRLSTAAELENLPWARIYHTGPFDPHQDSDIT
ncbi:MAG TPA: DUF4433 domain-containing protein, partial [Candidatus Fraserbacteria bacterium]|nr:DUF4433 domain-containing protein [Candidatus Fraserbacteria bacterium]